MTHQKASFSESNGNILSCQINLLLRAKVSRAPELTDLSEKSDDVRTVSSPGLFLKKQRKSLYRSLFLACHQFLPNLPGKKLEDANISTFSPRSQVCKKEEEFAEEDWHNRRRIVFLTGWHHINSL